MRGGARVGAGRRADPNALRRERRSDRVSWTVLPAQGRPGPAPDWPLEPAATAAEAALWGLLWSLPQAWAWERLGQACAVALFVRRSVEAGAHGAPAALASVVLRLESRLGLSASGMEANRWRIA